ncbi:g4910 [Coccomyxa viridis]|uniref:G4910 protein n=1 Tax=Coccomyxa viridis TaxID=1274662 RepID=A0ABP1FRG8_9CHLO
MPKARRFAMHARASTDKDLLPRLSQQERLFSNLDGSMKHEAGSLYGSVALIAGTTVGAGILALPYTTQDSGFIPSSASLFGTYVFSIVTGLLLAEANVNLMCELGKGGVSITSISRTTLGTAGERATTVIYIALHYALLVAYTAKSGELLQQIFGGSLDAPVTVYSVGFCGLLAALCYGLRPAQLDKANTGLLGAVFVSFAGLVWAVSGQVRAENLLHTNWSAVSQTLPVLSLAFVYQNVVPVVCSRLEGDLGKIRTAIIGGLSIPLLMFIVWNGAILGSIDQAPGSGQRVDPLSLLTQSSGPAGLLIQVFSLFAIATSYIGFVLGLTDFLADLLKLPSGQQQQKAPYALTVIPPFILAALFPQIFFKALDFAGTYGVLTLFGLVPAASVWSQRYNNNNRLAAFRAVPGGKPVLLAVGLSAGGIIVNQFFSSILGSH